jgi:hypothetical protein
MQITAVDDENNLFKVKSVFPEDFVQEVLATDWLNLPWSRQEGQESWARRRINETAIPWIDRWQQLLRQQWHQIAQQTGIDIHDYSPALGTSFWLDEPGFTCELHTDGMMPGAMQLVWQGTGTTFYWYKDTDSVRYQMPNTANTGYIMLHSNNQTYQKLLWHCMLTPVPADTFRLTSYTWLSPK